MDSAFAAFRIAAWPRSFVPCRLKRYDELEACCATH